MRCFNNFFTPYHLFENHFLYKTRLLYLNLSYFFRHPINCINFIKLFAKTYKMSRNEKRNILIKATKQTERILTKNGLIWPFEVTLEDFDLIRDEWLLTFADYQSRSLEEYAIKISVKSHLIGNDIERIVVAILHEYSHAVYEAGAIFCNFNLLSEISKLESYYLSSESQKGLVYSKYDLTKERFCECFSLYLLDKLSYNLDEKETENLKNIFKNIINYFSNIFKCTYLS